MTKITKTPIVYYGGKASMCKYILPFIPKHRAYVEPFLGGGAVFWTKKPSKVEVLNDFNSHVTNFYEVLKTDFKSLNHQIQATLHSRDTYKSALTMYYTPHHFTKVQRAWAFWVLTSQGFSGGIGSWSYSKYGKKALALYNKKLNFTSILSERLEKVEVECNDALKVIKSRDSQDTFFYIDPPYVGAHQSHYHGYTEEHFIALLNCLSHLEGKFILSSYPNELLTAYTKENNWHTQSLDRPLRANLITKNQGNSKRKRTTEVLTMNYNFDCTNSSKVDTTN
jgi:DNA adenine methylase